MLSKVLKSAGQEIAPVAWRRQTGPLAAPAKPDTPPVANAELAQFSARIAELEAAAEAKARQAYAAGLQAGEESARQNLEAGVQETVRQWAAAISELSGMRAEIMRRAEADTVRLSLEIARRALHRELSVDGSALEALVRAAMERLQAQEVYRVRVHPGQEKAVRSCLDRTAHGQSVAVVVDPLQPKGGAVFEIGRGSLDASLETQLAEIEHGLIDRLEARA
jgi:flagellar biosynthesis/type III secretory pathway protein FliH